MSRTFNGSTDKGVISSALLTSLASTSAFHISIWCKSDSLTALQIAFGVGSTSSSAPLIAVGFDGTITGDKMYAYARDNNATGTAINPSNGYSSNTWHNLIFRNVAYNNRFAYLDNDIPNGANSTNNANATFSPGVTSLGCLKRTTESLFFSGKIARCTIWRGSSSAALPNAEDRVNIQNGADPTLIRNSDIAYHWDDDLAAVTGGQSWTWTGTATDADNPTSVTTPVVVGTASSWEVPAGGGGSVGFTNTGLGYDGTNLLIGDFDNSRIVIASKAGAYVGEIELASAPASSVQGVAYDSSDGTYWVSHYAATNGTIRHYNSSGTLLGTISPGIAVPGPNGNFYDAANDRIVAVWDDGTVRGYDCADSSLDETVTLALNAGQTADGLAMDPNDPSVLWASVDVSGAGDYLKKYDRSTGALLWAYSCGADPENLCFVDGEVWMCFDRFYHSAEANGNRVHKLDITYLPVLDAVTASSLTSTGARLTVTT